MLGIRARALLQAPAAWSRRSMMWQTHRPVFKHRMALNFTAAPRAKP